MIGLLIRDTVSRVPSSSAIVADVRRHGAGSPQLKPLIDDPHRRVGVVGHGSLDTSPHSIAAKPRASAMDYDQIRKAGSDDAQSPTADAGQFAGWRDRWLSRCSAYR